MRLKGSYIKLGISIVIAALLTLFFIFLGVPFSVMDDLILHDKDFVKDAIAVFLGILLILYYLYALNNYLDRHYQWQQHFKYRLTLQFAGGLFIPALFVWFYIYGYRIFVLHMVNPQMEQFASSDFPVSILVIAFLNLCFIGYFFIKENQEKQSALSNLEQELFTLKAANQDVRNDNSLTRTEIFEENTDTSLELSTRPKIRTLIATVGSKNIPIPVEAIAYVYKQGNYIELKTFEESTYLLNHTLEELMQLLNETQFFRANRQFIVNLKSCHFFTNEENGKLALHLKPAFDDEVIISQKRAQAFKDWLNK
jgi:hypothetical protein